ncbi:uncharacterized protein LOC133987763 [Scomber scombrus]|uniref:uncharacterized protein LOC133987763 n=1 Tax=Scomber scombrus TaxID=13677 RepID=UPI002DDC4FEC|nr:uncharacterized protein LOC133987763 [Scomber scombrus]
MRYYKISTGSRVDVTITQLRKADSGHYWCGLDNYWGGPYQKIKITVTDAPPPSKPKLTGRPAPPPPPTTTTTTKTTTQSFRRSSASSSSSTKTTNQSEQKQTEPTTDGGSGVPLYVGLTLFFFMLLFSVAVLILCKKRASKPKEHPEETVYANVTETSREEIRESDGQSRSAPVENSADYSVITAAASRPLSKPEDDSIELVYTQVDFSNRAASSLSSAPSGQADNVIYSAPQRRTDAKVDSQPLYSTVTPRQKL